MAEGHKTDAAVRDRQVDLSAALTKRSGPSRTRFRIAGYSLLQGAVLVADDFVSVVMSSCLSRYSETCIIQPRTELDGVSDARPKIGIELWLQETGLWDPLLSGGAFRGGGSPGGGSSRPSHTPTENMFEKLMT